MINISTELNEEVPRWDVALEALTREEYLHKRGGGLRIEDFRRLADQYAIRFDDIMVTMFEMTVHGRWAYYDASGVRRVISRAVVNQLYVNGRLNEADVKSFDGGWRPLDV